MGASRRKKMLVNRIVLLVAAIVLVPVAMFAGYFLWKIIWPPSDAVGETVSAPPPARRYVPAPERPAPEPVGPVLKPAFLPGEEVTRPLVDRVGPERYRIQPGDTLFDIAVRRYGDSTYVQDILRENPGLSANLIRAGDEIILPRPRAEGPDEKEPERPKVYVVEPGDTLIGIARRMYGDFAMYVKVFEANRDRLSSVDAVLPEGLRLRLPPPEQD